MPVGADRLCDNSGCTAVMLYGWLSDNSHCKTLLYLCPQINRVALTPGLSIPDTCMLLPVALHPRCHLNRDILDRVPCTTPIHVCSQSRSDFQGYHSKSTNFQPIDQLCTNNDQASFTGNGYIAKITLRQEMSL